MFILKKQYLLELFESIYLNYLYCFANSLYPSILLINQLLLCLLIISWIIPVFGYRYLIGHNFMPLFIESIVITIDLLSITSLI